LSIVYFNFSYALDCSPGQYQVREHPRTEYYRKDSTYVSEAQVKTYCKEYQNFQSLKLKFQEKMPRGWPHKKEKFIKWPTTEKKKITDTINNLPKVLNQAGELKILRADKSETPANPATSAPENKIIVIYDLIKEEDYQKVLAHELAHILYISLPEGEVRAYNRAASWKEDFANNVEHFLFDKDAQKVLNKKIYDCLKEILGKIK